MAGVDTSIYGNSFQPPNLTDQVYKMLQLQQFINQNKLFQQEYAAKQAMGPLLQSSIGDDGEIDYNKASVLMAGDPRTAFLAPDFAKEAIARKKAQADTLAVQLDNTKKINSIIADHVGPVAAKGADATQNDLISAAGTIIAQLKSAGVWNPKMSDTIIDVLSKAPKDGKGLADYASSINQSAMTAQERADALQGKLFSQDQGGYNQIVRIGPDGQPQVLWREGKTLAPQAPTDIDKRVAYLQQSGVPRDMAVGIASGRYVVSVNPQTENRQVIDVSTGKQVGELPEAPAAPSATPDSYIPSDVNPRSALGLQGHVNRMINSISDYFGNGLPLKKAEDAKNAMNTLDVTTKGLLEENVPGRPSNIILQQLDKLTATPDNTSGVGSAKSKFSQVKQLIDTEVNRISSDVLSKEGRAKFKPKEIQDAEQNLSELKQLSRAYGTMLDNIDTKAKASRPPISQFDRK